MYGLPLSQSDQRIRAISQSVYNNKYSVKEFVTVYPIPKWLQRLSTALSTFTSFKKLFQFTHGTFLGHPVLGSAKPDINDFHCLFIAPFLDLLGTSYVKKCNLSLGLAFY